MLTGPSPAPAALPRRTTAALVALSLALAGLVAVVTASPAAAESRVGVANAQGSAVVDPTYATTLTLRGQGFQSIKNGHGGIYVFFGTVSGTWRPSQGGQTGRNLLYVPDSETKDNQGFQKFVAFPGSDTASAANGGTLAADGSWSTRIVVPGAVFKARDRSNRVTRVDCRRVRCGIITIGAHGVKNARNETFTPVSVADLTAAARGGAATSSPSSSDGDGAAAAGGDAPTADAREAEGSAARTATRRTRPVLAVDRETAVAGHVLSFSATGLRPGEQVTATLDDGVAAVGPLTAGADGQLAGALALPADVGVGTHELRLSGGTATPSVSFPVAAPPPSAASTVDPSGGVPSWLPMAAAGLALLLLVGATVFAVRRLVTSRRKEERRAAALA
ncbi:hypothetical protein QE370_003542 [Aeromicrobium sp. SORGH_AS981]|uniref:hypothetical protein n=1 Tax=Aeromicrobium sp. SORGH_AS_0981 TaxID=3041802 RepID=UPI002862C47E|nr:hypothetical protein [Aeromicrobium sp. SORGH_AS_0981]MDR6120358.1 hypothetical protein [Aeromicrobium sp. SORGH_AS_0981]